MYKYHYRLCYPPFTERFQARYQTNFDSSLKTTTPKVTVFMPAYNCARFIEEAIESVLNQTLQDFELIIVNDGSTDNTLEVLEKYQSYPKLKILTQENKGIGAASNLALSQARGEYISQCDADDILLPEALEVLARELDSHPSIGYVYGGRIDLKNNQEIIKKPTPYQPGSFLLIMKATSPRMWRYHSFLKTEGFNEQIRNAVDYDMALKLEEVCHVKTVNAILYKYRWHTTNTSVTHNAEQKDNSVLVLNNAIQRRRLPLKAIGYNHGAIYD